MDLNVLFFCGCDFMRSIRSGLFFRFLGFATLFRTGYFFSNLASSRNLAAGYFFSRIVTNMQRTRVFVRFSTGHRLQPPRASYLLNALQMPASHSKRRFFSDISGTVLSEAFFYIIAPPYGDPPHKPGFCGFC